MNKALAIVAQTLDQHVKTRMSGVLSDQLKKKIAENDNQIMHSQCNLKTFIEHEIDLRLSEL